MATYQERINENLSHMGTTAREWKAVPIIGVANVADPKGKPVQMPVFDFPKDYKKAPTLFPISTAGGEMNCELCSKTPIKTAYHIQNDKHQWLLIVGSECVTKFEEGKSGKENVRDFQLKEAEALAEDCRKTAIYLKENFSYVREQRDYYGRIDKTRQWNTAYVGEAGYAGNDKILELKSQGKLEVLLNLKRSGVDTIYWFYVYEALPVFRDKYEADENTKREKELLSWYKRNETKARELITAIQAVANTVNEEKLELQTVSTQMALGGVVNGYNYSIGGL